MIIRRFRRKKATTRDINAGLLVERGWAGPTRPCLSIAFCKICFTKFVEEMWNQDGVTGKKLGIHVNQKEEGRGLDFLSDEPSLSKGKYNEQLTYLLTFCIDEFKTSMSPLEEELENCMMHHYRYTDTSIHASTVTRKLKHNLTDSSAARAFPVSANFNIKLATISINLKL